MLNTTEPVKWGRWLITGMLLLTLGACSSTPEPPVAEEVAEGTNESETTQLLTPEAALAQRLQTSPNRYQSSKKALTETQQSRFARTAAFLQQADAEQALACVMPLLSERELPSAVWVLRGDIAALNGENEAASDFYHQAVTVNPFNYFALNRLGLGYRERGQFKSARDYYEQAISAWPGFAPAYYNLGILNDIYLGDKSAAKLAYEQYLALISFPQGEATEGKRIKQVKRWIADVERQLQAMEQEHTE